jgi:GNAT superfamily N-acetyltransferase
MGSHDGNLGAVHIAAFGVIGPKGRTLPRNSRARGVTLAPAGQIDVLEFARELQEAFSFAILDASGASRDLPIPSDSDIQDSVNASESATHRVLLNGEAIGGAVLSIDPVSQRNALDLFYIAPRHQGCGLGHAAWRAIEAHYPATRIWETHTPYLEKRNVHFYVNKCGFKIVAYYNAHHRDPLGPPPEDVAEDADFFRLEKIMRNGP